MSRLLWLATGVWWRQDDYAGIRSGTGMWSRYRGWSMMSEVWGVVSASGHHYITWSGHTFMTKTQYSLHHYIYIKPDSFDQTQDRPDSGMTAFTGLPTVITSIAAWLNVSVTSEDLGTPCHRIWILLFLAPTGSQGVPICVRLYGTKSSTWSVYRPRMLSSAACPWQNAQTQT